MSERPAAPLHEDLYVLGLLAGLAGLLVAGTFPHWGGAVRLLCPLRELTGIPCPTCFGTRAVLALMAGDWRDALRLNPLVGAAGIGLFAWLPWAAATVAVGLPRPRIPVSLARKAAWAGAGLVALNWIYLIVTHL